MQPAAVKLAGQVIKRGQRGLEGGQVEERGNMASNEPCPTPRSGLKQAIDHLPFGSFHLRVFIICGSAGRHPRSDRVQARLDV